MSAKRQTKFTVTIYCHNCRTVGDYQFTRGTILHPYKNYPMAEYRNRVPGGENEQTIRLNDRHHGREVECKFCRCSTSLTMRERNGDALVTVTFTEPAPLTAPQPERGE